MYSYVVNIYLDREDIVLYILFKFRKD